jgi:predicted nucleotidyltransferase
MLLFGSYARGDARPTSDVDVIVLLAEESFDYFSEVDRLSDVAFDLGLEFGHLLQPILATEQQLRAQREPLFSRVLAEGIEI